MLVRIRVLGLTVVLGSVSITAACRHQSTVPADSGPVAHLRVLNTNPADGPVDVLVVGRVVIASLAPGSVSPVVEVPAGAQAVSFRRTGTGAAGAATTISFSVADTTTLLTVDSGTVINPMMLTDSGATVPAGRSKLRVVHFAKSAPAVLFWRSQPDFPTFTSVMFPFPYRATSGYLESDPGDWRVFMATARYSGGFPTVTDTLYMTRVINVPAGVARTVVFLDADSGGFRAAVLTP